ncbi:PucR family transcriptional regulator [Nocardioides sp. NPDC087217]|uniref:PucR family transcriptional regulator n=1 Tax=Nocardioides sp. NPDC087217 TaxID=3364335 RepID=UPI00380C3C64
MTGPSSWLIGGHEVTQILSTRIPDLTDEVLRVLTAELPVYARLPTDLLNGDVRKVVARAIRLFVTALDTDGRPDDAALADLAESAARRAEEGVPFEMVVAAYHRGARVCADTALAGAGPEDVDAVRAILRTTMSFLEHIAVAVASGYAQHSRTALAEQAASRTLLVNTLVEGGDIHEAAGRAGVPLPASYLVATLAAGAHPDESDPDTDPLVAARWKLRRIHEELSRHYRETVLWIPATDGGQALIPLPAAAEESSSAGLARLERILADVRRAAGAEIHVGVAVAAPSGVPEAARLSREVLEVALLMGRPPGLYRLADVVLEHQLSRAGAGRDLLVTLLEPLDGHEGLGETLQVFLASGLNRRRTASTLHVHPNTVDNRIRRVSELTGLDATRAEDLPLLHAAVTARRTSPGL